MPRIVAKYRKVVYGFVRYRWGHIAEYLGAHWSEEQIAELEKEAEQMLTKFRARPEATDGQRA